MIASAPVIGPVPAGEPRPRWSVMIPTFNCAAYLRRTLCSVLAQAPGPEAMHIEVVDDCSTKDDPGAVVREVGAGRVEFHRKPQNAGITANFNTCLARSRGELVHVLHGDDFVLPGFYAAIEAAAAQHPDVGLLATRIFYTDSDGYAIGTSPRLREMETPSRSVRDFFHDTPVQFAGVVVRRTCYETLGGFRSDLTHMTDRDMWIRVIARFGGILLPEPRAAYRIFEGNDTARQKQTAENLHDRERLNTTLAASHPDFDAAVARRHLLADALGQYWRFVELKNEPAAAANLAFWRERAALRDRLRFVAARLRRRLQRWL